VTIGIKLVSIRLRRELLIYIGDKEFNKTRV
jgi:hypothetical protein